MKVVILGGGMIGILAKFLFPSARVLDWRRTPPPHVTPMQSVKQYGAHYLWEPLEGVPCRSFQVITTIDDRPPTVDAARRYKTKIGKLEDIERDPDMLMAQFPHRMPGYEIVDLPGSEHFNIEYEKYILRIDVRDRCMWTREGDKIEYDILINTIPLPALLTMARTPVKEEFEFRPICIKVSPIPIDAPLLEQNVVRVNYLSDPRVAPYRTTDRDGVRQYEWLRGAGTTHTGIPTRVIKPGKILPCPQSEVIITWLMAHGVYCFGRFPRWRPDELLHDTYRDLRTFRKSIRPGMGRED